MINNPPINWKNVSKTKNLIGKNLLDIEGFESIINLTLSDRLKDLEDFCNKTPSLDFNSKLRKLCYIDEHPFRYYSVILPSFMSVFDILNNSKYYKMWNKLVYDYVNNN